MKSPLHSPTLSTIKFKGFIPAELALFYLKLIMNGRGKKETH
jgi:hypothetical protein